MLITITVARRNLDDIRDFLATDGMRKPMKHLWYRLFANYNGFPQSQNVGISLHEFRLLEDYEEDNKLFEPKDDR